MARTMIQAIEIMRSELSSIQIKPGRLIYCYDSQECFFDSSEYTRKQITDFVYLESEDERLALLAPLPNKLYIIKNTGKIYRYIDTEWFLMSDPISVIDIICSFEELTPMTMTRGNQKIAPRTVSTAVYTASGDILEDVIANISKVSMTDSVYVTTIENQTSIPIPFPFNDYLVNGNRFNIYIGGLRIDETKYGLSQDGLAITFNSNGPTNLPVGTEIVFVFVYNSKVPPNTITHVDGGYIVGGTILTQALKHLTDSYMTKDHSVLPTSLALNTLYDVLTARIDLLSNGLALHATSTGTTTAHVITKAGYTLVDGATIYLTLGQDMAAGSVTLQINGGTPIHVVSNGGTNTVTTIPANSEVCLSYSAIKNKFTIISGELYKVKSRVYPMTCAGGETSFEPTLSDFNPLYDNIKVYQGNVRLFEGINYNLTGTNTITLINYAAKAGESFVFEVEKVVKLNA